MANQATATAREEHKAKPAGLLDSPRWANHNTFEVGEVAEILRVSAWTIYEAVKREEIQVIRFGSVIRVPRRTVVAMLGEASR